ncbi:uncharacterized protein L969DRAFT_355970 [Mixia osmundae IAM 14324]|uniref:Secreted protein n=1 Tax=Mixia osmundae (strain CBS 9802 / IAM 14324 / JCM 22182 / KY 12970) TaxID=764103 RepID=G7E5E0_MIXOS|nr:uncharacterized protein L969DRAFT_355970 [Mixia osmundae IAM 14324]KEI40799.1 hypothetical protein L969DRAFT_355970 [Mixia osmundae IAM 14324]GAA98050.1 hypothetical protein E5Q_04731 [Mixia osmundae IAM 14324]
MLSSLAVTIIVATCINAQIHSQCYTYYASQGSLPASYNTTAVGYLPEPSGPGACGTYKSSDVAACLWSGSAAGATTGGWINPAAASNCGKSVIITANGKTAQGHVADGCHFGTAEASSGCPRILLTLGAFDALATTQDVANGNVGSLTWSFANEPM